MCPQTLNPNSPCPEHPLTALPWMLLTRLPLLPCCPWLNLNRFCQVLFLRQMVMIQVSQQGRAPARAGQVQAPLLHLLQPLNSESSCVLSQMQPLMKLSLGWLAQGYSWVSHSHTPTHFWSPHANHGVETASQLFTTLMYCICFRISHSLHDSSLPRSALEMLYVSLAETATSDDYLFSDR